RWSVVWWDIRPPRFAPVPGFVLPRTTKNGQRTMDKLTQLLIDSLKQAMARPGEQRLFRSGKLDGVFASRVGLSAEAAAQALRDGLLEQTRAETKGKTVVEWVRVTPRGVEFLHAHESPVRAMDELRAVLQANQEG